MKYIESNEEIKEFKTKKRECSQALECKICKEIPIASKVMLLCCNQIVGCQICFTQCMQENSTCPLCRAENPRSVVVNGLDNSL